MNDRDTALILVTNMIKETAEKHASDERDEELRRLAAKVEELAPPGTANCAN